MDRKRVRSGAPLHLGRGASVHGQLAGWLALHLSEFELNNTMAGPRVTHTAGGKIKGDPRTGATAEQYWHANPGVVRQEGQQAPMSQPPATAASLQLEPQLSSSSFNSAHRTKLSTSVWHVAGPAKPAACAAPAEAVPPPSCWSNGCSSSC